MPSIICYSLIWLGRWSNFISISVIFGTFVIFIFICIIIVLYVIVKQIEIHIFDKNQNSFCVFLCLPIFAWHRNNDMEDILFSQNAHLYKRMCIPTCMTYAYFFTVLDGSRREREKRKDVVYHVIQYNNMCTPILFRNTIFVHNIWKTHLTSLYIWCKRCLFFSLYFVHMIFNVEFHLF